MLETTDLEHRLNFCNRPKLISMKKVVHFNSAEGGSGWMSVSTP